MWLSQTPSLSVGPDFSFSIVVKNNAPQKNQFALEVFVDEAKKTELSLPVDAASQAEQTINISGVMPGTHQVKAMLYDAGKKYAEEGSKLKPYYVFFKIIVV